MGGRVYLDWNATAPLRPEARAAMLEAMDVVGNPSSVHAEGRAAKAIVERARAQVATLAGCEPSEVVFTSGATESAVTAVPHGPTVFSPIEHDAVLANFNLASDCYFSMGEGGVVDFREALRRGQHIVSMFVCAASGEVGLVNDLVAADGFRQEQNIQEFFCDATQALGKMEFRFSDHTMLACFGSSHKLGGPKGVGCQIIEPGGAFENGWVIRGGGQEMGRRSGTENVIGIAGFGAAAAAAQQDLDAGVWERVAGLRNILESRLDAVAKDIIFVGKGAERLPNTSCFAVPGWKGETQVMQMDLAGFAISAGSACSSGKVKASRVLRAMGYDEVTAASAVRVSLGPETTEEEVLRFVKAWSAAYRKRRSRATVSMGAGA